MTATFACPNLNIPGHGCTHTAFIHDIGELGDPLPACCVERCGCGHDTALRARLEQDRDQETTR